MHFRWQRSPVGERRSPRLFGCGLMLALPAAFACETGTMQYPSSGAPGGNVPGDQAGDPPADPTVEDPPDVVPVAPGEFVVRNGARLELAGADFRFAGSNNYYLMYSSRFMVDDVLRAAQRAGFNTMRTWGFLDIGNRDGSNSVRGLSGGVYFQYWDGSAPAYNDGESGLARLDYIVQRAGQLGIRLIIPLVNNWNDFGGMDQYVRWREGLGPEQRAWFHDDFYSDATIREWYRDWIEHVVTRVNTLTGVAYRDDPAIAMWELGNEPRCAGTGTYPRSPSCNTAVLLEWADVMTTHLRSLDPNHLISVGDEGFYCLNEGSHWTEQCGDGVDTLAFTELPNVDVMSMHLYPDNWGTDADWGTTWISRHVTDAKASGKPVLLGEFGLLNPALRNRVYHEWTDALVSLGASGGLYWILSGREDDGSLYGDFDGFTIYEGTPTFQTLQNFAASMISGDTAAEYAPVADHDLGYLTHDTSRSFEPLRNDVAYGGDVSALTIDLDPELDGVQTSFARDGHVADTQRGGLVAFTPAAGFVGRVELSYQVIDAAARVSNSATLGIVVSPDPVALTSFEAGTDGWVPQNPANGGSVAQSTAYASDGQFGLEVNGATNNWFGSSFAQPLDLSARRAISYDVQTLAEGTQTAVRVFFGEVRCQSAFGQVPANTTTTVEIDLTSLNCDGPRPASGLASSLYLRFSPGTFRLDRVQLW